jgi:hypothetical protein
MKNLAITTEFRADENAASVYDGKYCVATLNFNDDDFEAHDEMTEQEANEYYLQMTQEKEAYETDNY